MVFRYVDARNRNCDCDKTNKWCSGQRSGMEAAFLVQPWIAARTITDFCRLCYQAREGTGFLECKRAHLAGYNSLLATLKMEPNPQFSGTYKQLEDAKEVCLANKNPNEHCYEKMQTTLQHTAQLYDQMLDSFKLKYSQVPARPMPNSPM